MNFSHVWPSSVFSYYHGNKLIAEIFLGSENDFLSCKLVEELDKKEEGRENHRNHELHEKSTR